MDQEPCCFWFVTFIGILGHAGMAALSRGSSSNEESLAKYPKNTKPLENQVGGHSFSDGHHTIGMLRDEEGYVLKPVNRPEQGRKEIEFYEKLSKHQTEDILQLKKFVPEYFGNVTLSIENRSVQFLKLMDATKGYRKPCVMDVKIGSQTWEPGSPIEKQLREEAKYISKPCGFCIPGFQVYNIISGTVEKYGKDYGKKLQKDDIVNVLKKFLNSGTEHGRVVGKEIYRQLNTILEWWRVQRTFHIYSSSILMTYDANPPPPSVDEPSTTYVRVVLIDFAHVLPANGTPDLNYLSGLESFVQIFTTVINKL